MSRESKPSARSRTRGNPEEGGAAAPSSKASGKAKRQNVSARGGLGKRFPIDEALRLVDQACAALPPTTLADIATSRDPFRVLIACLLSLRTRDAQTLLACERLFPRASSPRAMLRLPLAELEELIRPVGFYRTKSKQIRAICERLMEVHGGLVPNTMEELLQLEGVGRKTANLTLTHGFGLPGICVDTHVHRICNRWGYVATKSPDETEAALRELLPAKHWIPLNEWLVSFGQRVCAPISPKCGECPLTALCARVGVAKHR
jgi:endonuclease-3